jgi:hypothetical protein
MNLRTNPGRGSILKELTRCHAAYRQRGTFKTDDESAGTSKLSKEKLQLLFKVEI